MARHDGEKEIRLNKDDDDDGADADAATKAEDELCRYRCCMLMMTEMQITQT